MNRIYFKGWHVIVEIMSYVIMLASLAVGIFFIIKYKGQQVPSHYALSGEADGYGSAAGILILPVTFLLVNGMSSAILHFMSPTHWNTPFKITPANSQALYSDIVELMVLIIAEISLFDLVMTIMSARQSGKGLGFATALLAVVALTIVLNMLKSYKHSKIQ